MNKRRPPIPKRVKRQIYIEAGNQCAACPQDLVLEMAHIVAFTKTRDHSPENLICLCPNCHSKADLHKWDEATFRYYKNNPWIKTQTKTGNGRNPIGGGIEDVIIVLKGKASEFTDGKKFMLKAGVMKMLDLREDEVDVKSIREGSVRVKISLPADKARMLFDLWNMEREKVIEALGEDEVIGVEMASVVAHRRANGLASKIMLAIKPIVRLFLGRRRDVDKIPLAAADFGAVSAMLGLDHLCAPLSERKLAETKLLVLLAGLGNVILVCVCVGVGVFTSAWWPIWICLAFLAGWYAPSVYRFLNEMIRFLGSMRNRRVRTTYLKVQSNKPFFGRRTRGGRHPKQTNRK